MPDSRHKRPTIILIQGIKLPSFFTILVIFIFLHGEICTALYFSRFGVESLK